MAQGRQTDEWLRTAAIRADIVNQFRKRPVQPYSLLPKAIRARIKKPAEPKPIKGSIEILKYLFVDRRDWMGR